MGMGAGGEKEGWGGRWIKLKGVCRSWNGAVPQQKGGTEVWRNGNAANRLQI